MTVDLKTELDKIKDDLAKLVAATNQDAVRTLQKDIGDAIKRAGDEFRSKYSPPKRPAH